MSEKSFELELFMMSSDLVIAETKGGAIFVASGLQNGVFPEAFLNVEDGARK